MDPNQIQYFKTFEESPGKVCFTSLSAIISEPIMHLVVRSVEVIINRV